MIRSLWLPMTLICFLCSASLASDNSENNQYNYSIVIPLNRLLHYNEGLRSDKVTWVAERLPDSLLRALPHSLGKRRNVFDVASYDLNGDGIFEYLVFDNFSGSGGSEYAIMQQQNGKWRSIGWIQGGFNIAPHAGKKGSSYPNIETWSRHGGEIFHAFWEFKNGSYRQVEAVEWPKEFRLDKPPFDECCIKTKIAKPRKYATP